MAIGVYLHKYSKRVNSTANPGTGAITGTIYTQIELKDVTNLYTPSLIFKTGNWTASGSIKNPMEYNYCYIPDFNRFYFIRTWSWILGRWECSLEIDVLGSHKAAIGNTTAYVLRSASEYDANVIDTKYPTKGDCISISQTQSSIWHTNLNSTTPTDGFYVIGIVNNDSSSLGAVSYYAMSGAALRDFMAKLYASPSWMNITDASISNDLQKLLTNPIQYVISCMYFPLSLSLAGLSGITTIPIGWWSIDLTSPYVFYKLTNSKLQHDSSLELPIPKHPAATGALTWLQNSPFSQYQLEFYPFGVFPIDSAKLLGYDKLRCEIKTDLVTGCGTLRLIRKKDSSNYTGTLFSITTQIAIPISMAQMSVDLSRLKNVSTWALSAGLGIANDTAAASELVNATANLIDTAVPDIPQTEPQRKTPGWAGAFIDTIKNHTGTGAGIGAGAIANAVQQFPEYKENVGAAFKSFLASAGKVASNIGNAVLASSGTCHMTGSTGTIAQYYYDQILTLFYFEIVPQDPVHYGYPLAASRKINTLSGFILCANEGDLSVAATTWERQAIAAAMKEGFYYE